ncbi:MAG: hypothetical protein IJS89_01940, partial [Bacteroidaceae bacterium]|nr:hypothetical protein [Bacteroidaceae bacterium]
MPQRYKNPCVTQIAQSITYNQLIISLKKFYQQKATKSGRVHPLSFEEYYEAVGGEKAVALETYYLYGGLPAVVQLETKEQKQNYL